MTDEVEWDDLEETHSDEGGESNEVDWSSMSSVGDAEDGYDEPDEDGGYWSEDDESDEGSGYWSEDDEPGEDGESGEDEESDEVDWSSMSYVGDEDEGESESGDGDVDWDEMYSDDNVTWGDEETFEDTESEYAAVSQDYSIKKEEFSVEYQTVRISDIIIPKPLQNTRSVTLKGLTTTISELGVLEPIHVLETEGYSEWKEDHDPEEDYYSGFKYQLVSGLRRLYAASNNKFEEIDALVIRFDNPTYGREMSFLLSLLLDKNQRHSWEEIWTSFKVLEESYSDLSPSRIESLLNIEPGEAMKLKDVMESQNDYPDIVDALVENKKTLQQAYTALQKARKEIEQWDRDDTQGISDVEEAESLVGKTSEGTLGSDAVKELLGMADEEVGDISDNFGGSFDDGPVAQRTDERHPLDPVLKGKVLARDGYSCQACHVGEDMDSSIMLGVLEVHHLIPVYAGKNPETGVVSLDTEENLITLCSSCHKLTHLVADADGKIGVTKEEFDELSEFQQDRWKNLIKYANVIIEAEKRSGVTRKKDSARKMERKAFWELKKENEEAVSLADQVDRPSDQGTESSEFYEPDDSNVYSEDDEDVIVNEDGIEFW